MRVVASINLISLILQLVNIISVQISILLMIMIQDFGFFQTKNNNNFIILF